MKLLKVARYLENELLKRGFIIHRYDAYSTNSIYLKLDYGACNSIRISDHDGKQYLMYKYNVVLNTQLGRWRKDGVFWRYYCGTSKDRLDELIDEIEKDRAYKKAFNKYDILLAHYKNSKDFKKGFWEKATEVK